MGTEKTAKTKKSSTTTEPSARTGKTAAKTAGKSIGKAAAKTKTAAKATATKTAAKAAPAKAAATKTAAKAVSAKATTAKTAAKAVTAKSTAKAVAAKTTTKAIATKEAKAAGAKAGVSKAAKTAGKTADKAVTMPVKETIPKPPMPKIDWQAFIEKMEQSLLEQKSGLIENLVANNNDFKEIVEGMDPKDFADIASDDIDRKMIEVLGSQELKRLRMIDSALTRIKQGKYGHCIKCNTRIPPDRLEALPYALMCIECKSEEERRTR